MSAIYPLPKLNGRVLWLIPSDTFSSIYQKEILRLAGRFNTASFTPHLTLGGLPDQLLESTVSNVREVVNETRGDISLNHKSVDCSSSPYQNLVHSLQPDSKLRLLQSDLKAAITNYEPKTEYHISLMYGQVPCEELTEETEFFILKLPQSIRISRICIIQLAERPELWKTVWETNI